MSGRLETALKIYADAFGRFLVEALKADRGPGRGWVEAYLQALNEKRRENFIEDLKRGKTPEDAVDLAHFKDVLLGNREVFKPRLGRSFNRAVTWADEIQEVRNKWAHQEVVPQDDLYRALDNIARLLMAAGAEEAAAQVKALRDGASPSPTGEPSQAAPERDPLGPWWRYAEPHPDIKRGEFDENTFAAKLDDVAAGRAGPEYQYADEFFKKTHLTRELKNLLADTLRRLAGTGGEAVVQLRTPFGGGKTHALIALYHLVNDAAKSGELPEVQSVLKEAGLPDLPRARVAVLVGTALAPKGRETEEGLQIRTLWGELAYQLGGPEAYALVAEADAHRVAPGKDRLIELLEKHAPALILMDEVLLYLVKASGETVGEGTLQGQTLAFLQELTEAAGAVEGVALLTTFPESQLEYMEADPDRVEAVFARLEKVFGRVQAVRVPVQKEEIFEVVRRRLFSQIDPKAAALVARAFSDLYRGSEDYPEETRVAAYRELLERAYPFHPELVNLLYERWGTLQRFQKTRGVLQLLARVVEQSYRSTLAGPVIGPGDVQLENPDLRAAVLRPLSEARWESVVDTDILDKARELDLRQGGEYRRHRLAQRTATAIFMYSHSGGGKDGVTKPWLDVALTTPEGPSRELVSDALDRLERELFYLYPNGAWVFRAEPNLNAVLNNVLAQVEEARVAERLMEHLRRAVGRGLLRAFLWPKNHKDVPDDTSLKLVVYGPEYADETEESKRIRGVVQQNAPGGPRVYKNTLVHLFMAINEKPGLFELLRREIALEVLAEGRAFSLSEEQRNEVEEKLRRVREAIPERVRAAYSELYDPEDSKGTFRYRMIRPAVQSSEHLVTAVEEELRRADRLLSALDPGLITHGEPPIWPKERDFLPLDELKDYFYRLPELPMLTSLQVLADAVVQGVREGLFELAAKGDGGYRLLHWTANPPERVIFSERYALVRPGVLPKPEPLEPGGERKDDDGGGGRGGIEPPGDEIERTRGPRGPRRVRIVLKTVRKEQIPALIDLLRGLEDAGGRARLSAELVAEATQGLDPQVLSLTVRELLQQYDFDADWEEN